MIREHPEHMGLEPLLTQRSVLLAFRGASAERARREQGLGETLATAVLELERLASEGREAESVGVQTVVSVGIEQERPTTHQSFVRFRLIAWQYPDSGQRLAHCVALAREASEEVSVLSEVLQNGRRQAASRKLALRIGVAVSILAMIVSGFVAYRQSETQRLYKAALDSIQASQWQDAQRDLQQLLSMDANYKDAPNLLLDSYYKPAASALEAGKWADARNELQKLVAKQPGYMRASDILPYVSAAAALEAGEGGKAQAGLPHFGYGSAPTILRDILYQAAARAMGNGQADKAGDLIALLNGVDPALVASKTELRQAAAGRYVQRWIAGVAQQPRVLTGQQGYVTELTFSADGRTLVSAGEEKVARVWDTFGGKALRTFPVAPSGQSTAGVMYGYGVALSPDGRVLATPAGGDVKLWDAQSGNLLRTLRGAGINEAGAMAFSPDGKALVAGGYLGTTANPKMWNIESGEQAGSFDQRLSGGLVSYVGFSPDGKTLVLAGQAWQSSRQSSPGITIWDVASQQKIGSFGSGSVHGGVGLSLDGALLAACGEDGLQVWDMAGQARRWRSESCNGVAVADGGLLVSGAKGVVNLWSMEDSRKLGAVALPKADDSIRSVALSPDASLMAAGGDSGAIYLWSVR